MKYQLDNGRVVNSQEKDILIEGDRVYMWMYRCTPIDDEEVIDEGFELEYIGKIIKEVLKNE